MECTMECTSMHYVMHYVMHYWALDLVDDGGRLAGGHEPVAREEHLGRDLPEAVGHGLRAKVTM